MQTISPDDVLRWDENYQRVFLPVTIQTNCPYCDQKVIFTPAKWHDSIYEFFVCRAECILCHESPRFFLINQKAEAEEGLTVDAELWIEPSPKVETRDSQFTLNCGLSVPCLSTYETMLRIFNTGEHKGTLALMQQFLVMMSLEVSQQHKSGDLKDAIKIMSQDPSLQNSWLKLSEFFAKGGPVEPFLKMEKEPDPEMTKMMIDLIELMLKMVYKAPQELSEKIVEIEEHLQDLGHGQAVLPEKTLVQKNNPKATVTKGEQTQAKSLAPPKPAKVVEKKSNPGKAA